MGSRGKGPERLFGRGDTSLGLEGQVRVSQGEDGKWRRVWGEPGLGAQSLENHCLGFIWLFSLHMSDWSLEDLTLVWGLTSGTALTRAHQDLSPARPTLCQGMRQWPHRQQWGLLSEHTLPPGVPLGSGPPSEGTGNQWWWGGSAATTSAGG